MGLKRIEFLESTAYTAAEVVVSDWVDVGEYQEGYFWLDVTVFATRVDETLDVVIERFAGNTAGYTTIATFTQIATAATSSEEELVVASLGGKIRARLTVAGTFSTKSITLSVKGEVKSV